MDDRNHTGTVNSPETVQLDPDDLVIFEQDEDGTPHFYFVKATEYRSSPEHVLPPLLRATPALLVDLGVVAADIPPVQSAGGMCVLLNLASIRNRNRKPELTKQLPKSSR